MDLINIFLTVSITIMMMDFFFGAYIKWLSIRESRLDFYKKVSDLQKALNLQKPIVWTIAISLFIGFSIGSVWTLPANSNINIEISSEGLAGELREWSTEFTNNLHEYNMTTCRIVEENVNVP